MPDLSATKTWTYLATSTFERIVPFIADIITARIFLLHALAEIKGISQEVAGGLDIRFPVLKELATAEDYTDLDTGAPSRASPATTAVYTWRQVRAPIVLSGRDMAVNLGSDRQVLNVLNLMVTAATQGIRDRVGGGSGIFSSNGDSASGIQGLQDMVTHTSNAQPTTGTSGGLSRVTFTTWRNQVTDVANDFSASGYVELHRLWLRCQRGDEAPDILVFTLSSYLNFLRNATSTLRYNLPLASNEGTLNVGFSNVNYNGAITGLDDGVAADMAYLLMSKYVHWMVHENRNYELGPAIADRTIDGLTWWVYLMANLCISNAARQGLLRRGDTD